MKDHALATALFQDLHQRLNLEKSLALTNHNQLQARQQRFTEVCQLLTLDTQPSDSSSTHKIHVVGSNGKSSLAFYLNCCARIQGNIGCYTSPHLLSPLERITVNSTPISIKSAYENLAHIQKKITTYLYKQLSYFEILTLLAMFEFDKQKCHLQIYEAGIGGRFDATKAACGNVIVLMLIDREHTLLLGSSKRAILREKLAIAGKCCQKVFYLPNPNMPDLEEQIREFLFESQKNESINSDVELIAMPQISVAKNPFSYLKINQQYALFILKKIMLKTKTTHAIPDGRLQYTTISSPQHKVSMYFDCAHNIPAITTTLSYLKNKNSINTSSSLIVFGQFNARNQLDEPLRNSKKIHVAMRKLGFSSYCTLTHEYFVLQDHCAQTIFASPFHLHSKLLAQITNQFLAHEKTNLCLQTLLEFSENHSSSHKHIIFLGSHRLNMLYLVAVSLIKRKLGI